jgi:hypothetical protein
LKNFKYLGLLRGMLEKFVNNKKFNHIDKRLMENFFVDSDEEKREINKFGALYKFEKRQATLFDILYPNGKERDRKENDVYNHRVDAAQILKTKKTRVQLRAESPDYQESSPTSSENDASSGREESLHF